jgi:hypothetical protein
MVLERTGDLEQTAACLEVTVSQTPEPWHASVVERLQAVRRQLARRRRPASIRSQRSVSRTATTIRRVNWILPT